jgi:hypothetical protein
MATRSRKARKRAAAKVKRAKPAESQPGETEQGAAFVYGFLSGIPYKTPRSSLVRVGPEVTSQLWHVETVINAGYNDVGERVTIEIRPKDARAGFKFHSVMSEDGVTFDCRVEALLDLAAAISDTAHVLGRLGGPVATNISAEG